ncbi:hypothetical protein ACJVC5_17015 [Peredibacter sp. HCB2-198]|uniref:hypothetical protein n=1 Tax=Peredibacter sp. HCB2-198 TaxID=3383025 RepID=UPI0038B5C582
MRKLISCFILLALAVNAWSYNERGNSGFTLICDDPQDNKFFDAWEAEHRYGMIPDYPEVTSECYTTSQCLASALVVARKFLKRLPEKTDIRDYAFYRISNFMAEVAIKDNIVIIPVDDIGTGMIPKNCTLRQTIVQKEPIFEEDRRYIISNDYWKLLTTEQRGVGIVHEILYGYYSILKIKPINSEKVRYLNALIISGKVEEMSPASFQKVMNQVYSNDGK